jgi:uncharacterized protein YecE (DUF72 family)
VLAIIIQPPSPIKLTLANGREWLDDVARTCAYHDYSVAFEFNHSSWFQDLTYNLLHEHKAAIVWSSFSSKYCSSPIITADFLYFRINGNERKWIDFMARQGKDSIPVPTKPYTLGTPLNLTSSQIGPLKVCTKEEKCL